MGLRIGVVLRADINKGSTRVRAIQFFEIWRKQGASVRAISRSKSNTVKGKLSFFIELVIIALWADIIFLQKPNLSIAYLRLIRGINSHIITDIDDAVWLPPASISDPEHKKVSHAIGQRFFAAAKYSKLVIAGSEFLRKEIQKLIELTDIRVVPPSVRITEKNSINVKKGSTPLNVGWIGSASNIHDLQYIASVLERLSTEGLINFILICDHLPTFLSDYTQFYLWNTESEYQLLSMLDIGLMPLQTDGRSLGRCGYKAIQYASIGIPTICTPLGAGIEVVSNMENGLWASSKEEWYEAIKLLCQDESLRKNLGKNAFERAKQYYDVEKNGAQIISLFKNTIVK